MRRFAICLFLLVSLVSLSGCLGERGSHVSYDIKNVSTSSNIMPIAVIGSGPAGLMAAVYGARGGKETYLLEGNKPGGLLMDTTEVENWPGEISINGPDIMKKLRDQAMHQGVQFVEDTIERVDFGQWPFKLYTENGTEISALSVVIATGASPRLLNVPGEDIYWGSGVTSCAVCDAPFFKNEEVVVVGGGDSAVEEGIQLAPFAKKITILVRKGEMRAASSMQERLKDYDHISIKYNVEIKRILGDDTNVTAVELYNNKTNTTSEFKAAGVFLAVGHNPNSRTFKDYIALDDNGYIHVEGRTQQTTVKGIFAAGDVEDHRYRQAGSSAGHGIQAGLDAVNFLNEVGYTTKVAQAIENKLYGTSSATAKSVLMPSEVDSISTIEELNKLLSDKQGLIILDFWAETCPSCKQMLPIIDTVAQELKGRATFIKVNTDEAPDLIEKLMVFKVPCLLVYKDGDLVARFNNTMSRKELKSFVEQFI